MLVLPAQTKRIKIGDNNLVEIIQEGMKELGMRSEELDIFVISSKAVATAEGRIIELSSMTVSEEAKKLSQQCGRSPEFCEAVLAETKMRNGMVCGTCPGAILTELKPWDTNPSDGFSIRPALAGLTRREQGTIITANAGLDESNTEQGTAVGWPEDPVSSARNVRSALQKSVGARRPATRSLGEVGWRAQWKESLPQSLGKHLLLLGAAARRPYTHPRVAVIISDSCVRPRRWGVTAFALTVAGIDPLRDEAGREDLFGRKLRITKEAIADQIATAANMLMGNADQSIPAVIVRDHGLALSDYEGWVPGIEPEEDLFRGIL